MSSRIKFDRMHRLAWEPAWTTADRDPAAPHPLVIGLTGGSGAGKGALAACFAKRGAHIIDADRVYHDLLLPPSACLDALCKAFGSEILAADGSLDRKKLAAIVFSDSERLERLNKIAHTYVMEEIRRQLAVLQKEDCPIAVIDAPQLFEAGAEQDCHIVVSVIADREIRLSRIMTRDGIGREQAEARIHAQHDDAFFRLHSHFIVCNNGDPAALQEEADKILSEMKVILP